MIKYLKKNENFDDKTKCCIKEESLYVCTLCNIDKAVEFNIKDFII